MGPPSYIVIADFESVLQPANDQISTTNTILQKHTTSMAAYLLVPIQHGNEALMQIH